MIHCLVQSQFAACDIGMLTVIVDSLSHTDAEHGDLSSEVFEGITTYS